MEFGAYLCTIGIIMLLCLLLFARLRSHGISYALVTFILAIAALIVFEFLSSVIGVIHFGQPTSLNIPKDYLVRGPIGWAVLAVCLLGLVSPFLAALLFLRKRQ